MNKSVAGHEPPWNHFLIQRNNMMSEDFFELLEKIALDVHDIAQSLKAENPDKLSDDLQHVGYDDAQMGREK